MDQITWQTVISILALFSGLIGYIAASWKIGKEVTLIEALTILEWTAIRKELEDQAQELSKLLRAERDGRRADREEFHKKMALVEMHYQETIKELQRKLELCIKYLAENNIEIEGLDGKF